MQRVSRGPHPSPSLALPCGGLGVGEAKKINEIPILLITTISSTETRDPRLVSVKNEQGTEGIRAS